MKKPDSFYAALWILAGFHLLVALAGFVAPYGFGSQDRRHPFAPPSRVHFFDDAGKLHRPFVYATTLREDLATGASGNEYQEDRSAMYPLRLFTEGEECTLLGVFHFRTHLFGVEPPARLYLLGADGFGRDQFSRLLFGGRVSLFSGLLAALLATCVGLILGGIAGFYGGLWDDIVMRVAEIFVVVPWFYVLIVVRAFLPLQMDPSEAFVLVFMVVGMVGWGGPARLVRGVALSARERNFVKAAQGLGASNVYLLRRHILPASLRVALTQLALLAPQFLFAEVVLSFLGLGVGEPVPSWGNMLAYAQQYHIMVSYWWMLLPVLALIPVFFTYHVLVDRLQWRLQLKE